MAAKRIFGIGDPILIARRAGELATEAGISLSCFDFALQNWMLPEGEQISAGTARADAPDPELRAPIAKALRVG